MAENKPVDKDTQKSTRKAAKEADAESTVLATIAEMPEPDRTMGERLHAIIKATAPDLSPRLWYGMPAYAKDGKVVCFYQNAQKFGTRYATFGFNDVANLDEGAMWPTAFALKELTPAEEAAIAALVKRAVQYRSSMIYHIVSESDFRSQLVGSTYVPASMHTDGFVHCSLEASVIPVANDYYAAVVGNLVLLEIDPDRLTSETRYEEAAPIAGGGTSHLTSSPQFPHVYGPIDTAAITRIGLLGKTTSGYAWPHAFTSLDTFLATGR